MSIDVQGGKLDFSGQVAEEIRAILGRRRVSARELARRLEVSPSWVSYRLTGAQEIGVNDLARIADALGVKIGDLLPRTAREVTQRYPQAGLSEIIPGPVAATPVPALAGAITHPLPAPPKWHPPAGQRRPTPLRSPLD